VVSHHTNFSALLQVLQRKFLYLSPKQPLTNGDTPSDNKRNGWDRGGSVGGCVKWWAFQLFISDDVRPTPRLLVLQILVKTTKFIDAVINAITTLCSFL
jgi:hypothetical protein